MIQNLIVALIVIAAFLYVLRQYLPATLRQRLVYMLSRGGSSQARIAKWLNTTASCGDGCDTCGSCETDASAPAAPRASPTGHRVIPINKKP